jgi:hypothetical protein
MMTADKKPEYRQAIGAAPGFLTEKPEDVIARGRGETTEQKTAKLIINQKARIKELEDAIEDAIHRMNEEPAKEVLRQALKPKQEKDLPTFEQMTGILADEPEQENG